MMISSPKQQEDIESDPFQSQTKVADLCPPEKPCFGNARKPQMVPYQAAGFYKKLVSIQGFLFWKKNGRKNLRTLWYTSPAGIPTVDGRNPIPNHLGCIEPCKQVCCAGWCWIWVLRALWRRWGSTLRAQVFRCRSQRCRGPRRGTPPCALLGSS